jgi:hypothetical protein
MTTTTSAVDAHLEIDPENVIDFVLLDPSTTTAANASQRVTITLTNPDTEGCSIAFKVRLCIDIRNTIIALTNLSRTSLTLSLSHTHTHYYTYIHRSKRHNHVGIWCVPIKD